MKQTKFPWLDENGKGYDPWAVTPVKRIEEKHAQKIAAAALKAEAALKALNDAVDTAQREVFEAKLKDAQIRDYSRMPVPDSLTFAAFDKSVRIDIKAGKRLTFDKSYVGMVKAKFEEFFALFDKDETSNKKFSFLREMVNSLLFKHNGALDQTSVNEIRSHKANAERAKIPGWQLFAEAVDLFDKAIRTEQGNRLIYVDVKDGSNMRRVGLKYTDV